MTDILEKLRADLIPSCKCRYCKLRREAAAEIERLRKASAAVCEEGRLAGLREAEKELRSRAHRTAYANCAHALNNAADEIEPAGAPQVSPWQPTPQVKQLRAALADCVNAMWADNPADGWKEIIEAGRKALAALPAPPNGEAIPDA